MNARGGINYDSPWSGTDRCSYCDMQRARVAFMVTSQSCDVRTCDRCVAFQFKLVTDHAERARELARAKADESADPDMTDAEWAGLL